MNPAKRKGTGAEVDVVQFLNMAGGYKCERRALAGKNDRGDVAGIPGLVIEVKNQQAMALAEWVDEANREVKDEQKPGWGFPVGVVWHKRRGKGSPGDWYVTMDGWAFLALLERWTSG